MELSVGQLAVPFTPPGPGSLVNLGANAVYIDTNTTVNSGSSIPIEPLGGMQVDGSQKYWLISGPGSGTNSVFFLPGMSQYLPSPTQAVSITGGSVGVAGGTLDTLTQLTQGNVLSQLTTVPQRILNGTMAAIPNGQSGSSPIASTAGLTQLFVSMTPGGGEVTCHVTFYIDAAGTTPTLTHPIYQKLSANPTYDLLPVLGPYVKISYQNFSGVSLTSPSYTVWGYSTPFRLNYGDIGGIGTFNLPIDIQAQSVAAGATFTVQPNPSMSGPGKLWFNGTNVFSYGIKEAAGSVYMIRQQDDPVTIADKTTLINLPKNDWEFYANNTGGVAATFYATVSLDGGP